MLNSIHLQIILKYAISHSFNPNNGKIFLNRNQIKFNLQHFHQYYQKASHIFLWFSFSEIPMSEKWHFLSNLIKITSHGKNIIFRQTTVTIFLEFVTLVTLPRAKKILRGIISYWKKRYITRLPCCTSTRASSLLFRTCSTMLQEAILQYATL